MMDIINYQEEIPGLAHAHEKWLEPDDNYGNDEPPDDHEPSYECRDNCQNCLGYWAGHCDPNY